MKWNFPIKKVVECNQCGQEFEITLVDRNSEEHICPNCGTVYIFDFKATEKEVAKQLKQALRKKLKT